MYSKTGSRKLLIRSRPTTLTSLRLLSLLPKLQLRQDRCWHGCHRGATRETLLEWGPRRALRDRRSRSSKPHRQLVIHLVCPRSHCRPLSPCQSIARCGGPHLGRGWWRWGHPGRCLSPAARGSRLMPMLSLALSISTCESQCETPHTQPNVRLF